MSIKEVPGYVVICDWPGCGVPANEDGDFAFWTEKSSAIDSASDAGWWETTDGEKHYCGDSKHVYAWASDHENGEPYPDPPYLLIHDGDDPKEEDGRVSLITAGPPINEAGEGTPL